MLPSSVNPVCRPALPLRALLCVVALLAVDGIAVRAQTSTLPGYHPTPVFRAGQDLSRDLNRTVSAVYDAPASGGIFGPGAAPGWSTCERAASVVSLPSCERRTWHDKRRHFLLSAAFTGSSYLILKRGAGLSKSQSLWVSAGAVGALGIAKEIYDRKHGDPPCFSRLDLLANGLGILTAGVLIWVL